jgi:putative sigma-54 modulation protein
MKNLTIHCKDFELTDAIKEYANEKVSALTKYLNEDDAITYTLRLGKTSNHHNAGKIFFAELNIAAPHKHYDAKVEADDTYAAIDLLKDEMAGIIRNHRDKMRTVSRRDAQKLKTQFHSADME